MDQYPQRSCKNKALDAVRAIGAKWESNTPMHNRLHVARSCNLIVIDESMVNRANEAIVEQSGLFLPILGSQNSEARFVNGSYLPRKAVLLMVSAPTCTH